MSKISAICHAKKHHGKGVFMEKLNYKVLKESGYKGYILEKGAPVNVLQFG